MHGRCLTPTPGSKKQQQAEHQQQPNAPAAMPPKKQKVLELDDEPRVKQEPGVEQQQQQQQQQQRQPAREAQGVVGGDGVVEALVVSNSRLCAQVAACDARAFAELERARVLEEQLTEGKRFGGGRQGQGR